MRVIKQIDIKTSCSHNKIKKPDKWVMKLLNYSL